MLLVPVRLLAADDQLREAGARGRGTFGAAALPAVRSLVAAADRDDEVVAVGGGGRDNGRRRAAGRAQLRGVGVGRSDRALVDGVIGRRPAGGGPRQGEIGAVL